jgi:hypothetical protein
MNYFNLTMSIKRQMSFNLENHQIIHVIVELCITLILVCHYNKKFAQINSRLALIESILQDIPQSKHTRVKLPIEFNDAVDISEELKDLLIPDQDPSPADQDPSPADQDPSPADKDPSPADKDPSPADKDPSPADKDPSPADQDPSPADKDPSPAGQDPSPDIITSYNKANMSLQMYETTLAS